MLLVTDRFFPIIMAESGFKEASFKSTVRYGSIENLLEKYCKDYKTAEMYWSSDGEGIYRILVNHGIKPVVNVNKIQKGMVILCCYNDQIADLITIENIMH